nr:MAG TPA: hypothetical protein [Caudoviricetes sp.]
MRMNKLKEESNPRLVKMLQREKHQLYCPICSPNHGCNSKRKGKTYRKKAFQLRRAGRKY